jgi:hypothetical protein
MSLPTQAPADCYSQDFRIRRACRDACTKDTCPLSFSFWAYLPSLPANSLFAALFGISLLLYSAQAIVYRRFLWFSGAMIIGGFLEVLGYAGRLWAFFNPFTEVASRCIRPRQN